MRRAASARRPTSVFRANQRDAAEMSEGTGARHIGDFAQANEIKPTPPDG